MPRKPWDFGPEPPELHKRVAAGELEKQLIERLASPENAGELQQIKEFANSYLRACASFVTSQIPDAENYLIIRMASKLLHMMIRQK